MGKKETTDMKRFSYMLVNSRILRQELVQFLSIKQLLLISMMLSMLLIYSHCKNSEIFTQE
jgi:hypothetical protein